LQVGVEVNFGEMQEDGGNDEESFKKEIEEVSSSAIRH